MIWMVLALSASAWPGWGVVVVVVVVVEVVEVDMVGDSVVEVEVVVVMLVVAIISRTRAAAFGSSGYLVVVLLRREFDIEGFWRGANVGLLGAGELACLAGLGSVGFESPVFGGLVGLGAPLSLPVPARGLVAIGCTGSGGS